MSETRPRQEASARRRAEDEQRNIYTTMRQLWETIQARWRRTPT